MASTLERDICSILVETLHRVDIVSAVPIEKGITLQRLKDGEFNLSIIIYVANEYKNDCDKMSDAMDKTLTSLLELDKNKDVSDSLGSICLSIVAIFEYTGKGQTVPKDVEHVRFHPSVVKVDRDVFRNCYKLREVVLNNGLREIGSNAFSYCNLLQSITIPSTVTKIGNRAFEDCVALESIVIPSTVEEICGGAFNDCTYLREVVLNDGLKLIWSRSFQKCRSLQSIILPFTIKVVFKYTFWDCTSLREVVIHNERVQIDEKAFSDCKSLERFKFPGLWTRLDDIIQAGQTDIEAKLDNISSVEWRGGELSIPIVRQQIERPWGMDTVVELDKEKLTTVKRLIGTMKSRRLQHCLNWHYGNQRLTRQTYQALLIEVRAELKCPGQLRILYCNI